MKEEIAEALLSKIMGWSENELSKERLSIQMMEEIKFDDYQQYTQGMRYIESLALWLSKIEEEDRCLLYEFIKNNLIFISETQMRQLIDMSFYCCINPILIKDLTNTCNKYGINDVNERKNAYKLFRRRSLFLGLSDGAHIDIFRRSHPFLSNEQINIHYDFSKNKVDELKKELSKDIKSVKVNKNLIRNEFEYIFLLDDFSASGISFIRKENDEWKGKIAKFLDTLKENDLDYSRMNVYIILYLATNDSLKYIKNQLDLFKKERGLDVEFNAIAVQLVEKVDMQSNEKIEELLNKYYQKYGMKQIETTHYTKGEHKNPYLGFNECSLPLVIYHNTPNNSLPIIWFDNWPFFKGLFPRVTRHKED